MNPFEAVGVWLTGIVAWVLDAVSQLGPVWGTVIAGVAILLETTLFVGLIVPGDTVVLAAATAVHSPWHYAALWVVVTAATLAGQSIGFALGRWVGPALRRSSLGMRFGRGWDRAADFVDRRGGTAVFVSRFLPVLHALMPVTVGMSSMTYARFIRWAAPAAVLWTSAYATAGALAGAAFRSLLVDRLHWAGYVFAAVIVVFFVAVVLVKRRLDRAVPGERDEDPTELTTYPWGPRAAADTDAASTRDRRDGGGDARMVGDVRDGE